MRRSVKIRKVPVGEKPFAAPMTIDITVKMPQNPQIFTRVEEDIAEEVEAFAEENDLSKSEATRRFLLAGMSKYDRLPASVAPSAPTPDDSDTDDGSKPLLPSATEVGHDIGRATVFLAVATLAGLVGWAAPAALVPLSVVGLMAYVTLSAATATLLIALGQFVGLGGYIAALRRDATSRLTGGDP